jgi:hypothetical protein
MGRLLAGLACASLVACASHHHPGGDAGVTYSSIRVAPDQLALNVPLGGTLTQDYAVFGTDDSGEHDITTSCALGVDSAFGTFNAATLTVGPHGGTTQVLATCGAQTGTASLTVNLVGTVIGPGAPANADQIFGSATAGTDATRTPIIEYPIDQAVAPLNLPPIEVQWKTASNDLFHIALKSTYASLDVYTTDPQTTFSVVDWNAIAGTAVGDTLNITVEGLAQAAPQMKFASTPVAFKLSHDTIDTSAIYWWSSSSGSIMTQTFGQTSAPSSVIGNCSGCHSLSRAGSRIGYSRCVGGACNGEWVGFMKYDDTTSTWNEVVNADNKTIAGTYTTFAPVGNPFPDDTQSVAIVTSMSGTFSLYDPDTGTPVPSNLASVAIPGHGATMPDWSADGTKVVFASAGTGQSVDVSNSSIAMMSYAYSGGQHTFGTPSILAQQPLTVNGQSYTNLYFPSFSPDGQVIVFNAARTTWRNFTDAKTAGQRLMIVTPSGGAPIDLLAMNGGTGDQDITWPHWAPGNTSDYYWIVFSSERDYGHEVTAATSASTPCVANGVKQCKQIWIGAISKAQLMSGAIDPSSPPVWLPGQDTRNDNISPYWTVPAGLF